MLKVYSSNTKERGEPSIDIQEVATNVWGDHDTGSERQSSGNLGNGGKGEECVIASCVKLIKTREIIMW